MFNKYFVKFIGMLSIKWALAYLNNKDGYLKSSWLKENVVYDKKGY